MTTILIADDRRDTSECRKSLLQKRGIVVETAENGAEVLDMIARLQIDLIVMDMNMPEMDGCQATESVKSNPETHLIPVIICTAHPMPGDEDRAKASGCDGFLEKPIEIDLLISKIDQLLKVDASLSPLEAA